MMSVLRLPILASVSAPYVKIIRDSSRAAISFEYNFDEDIAI